MTCPYDTDFCASAPVVACADAAAAETGAPDEACPPGMRATAVCRSRPISAPVLPSWLAQLLLLISPLLPSWLAQLLVLQRRARRTRPARLACVQMLSACSRQPRAAWGRTSLQQGRKQTCKARESKDKQNFISATPYLQNRKHGQVRIKYKLINISYLYKYDFPVWY